MVTKSSSRNKIIDVKLDDKNIAMHEVHSLETLAVYTYYFNQEGLINCYNMGLVNTNSWASTLPAGIEVTTGLYYKNIRQNSVSCKHASRQKAVVPAVRWYTSAKNNTQGLF